MHVSKREYRMIAALQKRKLNMFSSEKPCFHRERWLGVTPLFNTRKAARGDMWVHR